MPINAPTPIVVAGNKAVSTTALSLADAPFSLTVAQLDRAARVLVTVEATNGLRYWFAEGATPTATEGHLVAGGGSFSVDGNANIKNLKMIRSGGADAVVQVTLLE